ncbi:OmpH family outer membrane protein [Parvularcula sp. IMCC14364]|uniref:OmpH family outer membrane protein n=1 Tax=Parvularcula sp. IMCC14364 TaxID=3067902 RepID=UPI00274144EE|nr:OmpH family outer membrane protein [Parvularcula sp. IMCC14364]
MSTVVAQEEAAPVILIVDQSRLLATSKAGKSVTEQMQALQTTANKELEETIGMIIAEAEELKSKEGSMDESVYLAEAQRLAIAQNNIPMLREIKVRELQAAEQKALGEISEIMRPILKEIVDSRGATLLLDRSAVMYASTDTDITEYVLGKLDEEITTVKVERIDLIQQRLAAQQRAAASQQQ